MIRTVCLDLDGPVLDGKFRHYRCYSDILLRFGYKPMGLEQYWQMKRLRLDRNKQLAVSGATEIYNDFLSLWLELIEDKVYLEQDQLQPLVLETLASWKLQGIKIILVTMRNRRDNLLWQLERLALSPLFDDIVAVGSNESGNAKSEAVRKVLTDSSRNNNLWVGDTEIDLKASRSLGIPICLLNCGVRDAEYLKSLEPDYLAQDLASVNNLRILNK